MSAQNIAGPSATRRSMLKVSLTDPLIPFFIVAHFQIYIVNTYMLFDIVFIIKTRYIDTSFNNRLGSEPAALDDKKTEKNVIKSGDKYLIAK